MLQLIEGEGFIEWDDWMGWDFLIESMLYFTDA